MDSKPTGTKDRAPVAVIGLGSMGTALAEAFLRNGNPTTVWNRTGGKADALVANGANRAQTVSDVVSSGSLLVVCLSTYDVVHEILDPVSDALSGRVLVNLTNGTPEQARELAAWAAKRGTGYVDGGIMAVPAMIGAPEALVLYSGSEDAFARHRELLENLGPARFLGSDAGLASLYDLALLAGMYGMLAGFYHSVALVGTEQIPAGEFTTLLVPWLNAMVGILPGVAEYVDSGDHEADANSVVLNRDALANILAASREQGIAADLLAPLQGRFEELVAAGHGAGGTARVVEALRSRS